LEDEVTLIDYLVIFWRRKWLILIPTFIFICLTGIYQFLQPKMWEVTAIILPIECLVFDQITNSEKFIKVSPEQMAIQINHGSYETLVHTKLNLDTPKSIKAKHLKGTNLVKISTIATTEKGGKDTLSSLSEYIRFQFIKKIEVSPVLVRIKHSMLIIGILCLIIFTMLAFFIEYIKRELPKTRR